MRVEVAGFVNAVFRQVSLLTLAMALASCDPDVRQSSDTTVQLAPRPTTNPDADSVASHAQAIAVAEQSNCEPLWPVRSRFTGALRKQVRLGPPGYGDTPAQDRRDTITVLMLRRAIRVCGDSSLGIDSVITTGSLQLTGNAASAEMALGSDVTVFGTLGRAVLGGHYQAVLFTVDSIPSLRPPRVRST